MLLKAKVAKKINKVKEEKLWKILNKFMLTKI